MTDILTSPQRVPFEWVEIDQPLCTRSYGNSPCAAILGTTGEHKCYNTRASCQDPDNFDGSGVLTLRFCRNRGVIPDDYVYLPYLESATVSAASINPGGGDENRSALGTRATLSCQFSDQPHTDLLVDPYLSERSWNPFERSTFWSKWRARNPYYLHRVIRHKSSYIDPATGHPDPATLITRTFFIVGFSGPDSDGSVQITAKDVLTLAANEKAKAPFPSTGKLQAQISAGDLSATLIPTGIGNLEYPASGKVRIDGEICEFTRSADVLTLTRARNNTTAAQHNANATVQLCLEYSAQAPQTILEDLLTTYAGVDVAYLDTAQWAAEAADYLPRLYSTLITEPTGVLELIGEMCEQMYFFAFWDERNALLKMRAVRPAADETVTYLDDDLNLLEGSIAWQDRPDSLITQVWVYYAQKNPTDSTTDARNFAALDIIADTDSESTDRNGLQKIKTIYSRWLTSADGAAAIELGDKILARYNEVPKEVSFSVDAKDRDLWLADFISISNRQNVDFTGAVKSVPMQIISAQEQLQGTIYSYQAIEYKGSADAANPGEFTIAISADMTNLNLRDLFDSLYAVTPTSGDKVRFTIRAGVTIGSRCTDAAFPTYSGSLRYSQDSDIWVFATRTVDLPYISRHDIVADADYSVGDTYIDPDTGLPTSWLVSADTKERPAATAITTGTWPAGVELFLDIEAGAMVLGEGGCGGNHPLHVIYTTGTDDFTLNNAVRAGDGGHALEILHEITITNQGIIAGGGGGGDFLLSNINAIVTIGGNSDDISNVFIPGGAGAGYRNGLTNGIFIYQQNVGEVDLPVSGVNYTQPSGAVKESKGLGGLVTYTPVTPLTQTNVSGDGGDLASDGGVGYSDRFGTSADHPTYNKPGRAGFAVKDGVELITWALKGDVRGAEY
jgi:hypothetical protein